MFRLLLLLRKLIKIDATRCLNMHQIQNFLGLRARPHWGSLQRSPRPPSWVAGAASRQGRGGEGMGGEERGGEALTVEPSHFSTGSDATV